MCDYLVFFKATHPHF